MSLALALAMLPREDVDRRTRERLAFDLLAHLQAAARAILRRSFSRAFEHAESEAVIDDAVQNVLVSVLCGHCAFRGNHEFEASAWCRTALTNQLRLRIRSEKRLRRCRSRLAEEPAELHAVGWTEPGNGSHSFRGFSEEDAPELRDALLRIEAIIGTQGRARDRPTVLAGYRCWLAHVLGVDASRQLELWGGDGVGATTGTSACPAAQQRARNRVYQYRRRGRHVALGAIRHLVLTGGQQETRIRLLALLFAGALRIEMAGVRAAVEAVYGDVVLTSALQPKALTRVRHAAPPAAGLEPRFGLTATS